MIWRIHNQRLKNLKVQPKKSNLRCTSVDVGYKVHGCMASASIDLQEQTITRKETWSFNLARTPSLISRGTGDGGTRTACIIRRSDLIKQIARALFLPLATRTADSVDLGAGLRVWCAKKATDRRPAPCHAMPNRAMRDASSQEAEARQSNSGHFSLGSARHGTAHAQHFHNMQEICVLHLRRSDRRRN